MQKNDSLIKPTLVRQDGWYKVPFFGTTLPVTGAPDSKNATAVATSGDTKDAQGASSSVSADEKEKQSAQSIPRPMHRLLANAVGRRGNGVGMKPMKIWLYLPAVTSTSSTTTAQAPVTSLVPGSCAEFTNLQALFDEYRVEEVKANYALVASQAGIAPLDWCVAYDAADSTAYGGMVVLLAAQRRLPPMHYTAGGGVSPLAVSPTGFVREWRFRIPKGVIYQSGGAVAGSATWSATSATSQAYGYLKAYVGAPSAGTTTLEGYVAMLCEFRNRT
jgi:hypothetical protein